MSSGFCDLMTVMGIVLKMCGPETAQIDSIPADDAAAWESQKPAPIIKMKPEPKPQVSFPPVVIHKTIVKKVPIPAPTKLTPVLPRKTEAEKRLELQREKLRYAMQLAYQNRVTVLPSHSNITISQSMQGMGKSAKTINSTHDGLGLSPNSPLALSTAIKRQGKAKYKADGVTSGLPVDNSRIIGADRYINVLLETSINTQLDGSEGGQIILQVTRDVYGYHGRNLLMPKGSRMICGVKSPDQVGETRSPLRCFRILLAGHRAEIFGVGENGFRANAADAQGRVGATGEVDNRFIERYGTAFSLAAISAAVRGAASSLTKSESDANSDSALSTSGEELSQRLGEISAAALESTINLSPILTMAQGTRFAIRPEQDIYIKKVEG